MSIMSIGEILENMTLYVICFTQLRRRNELCNSIYCNSNLLYRLEVCRNLYQVEVVMSPKDKYKKLKRNCCGNCTSSDQDPCFMVTIFDDEWFCFVSMKDGEIKPLKVCCNHEREED